MMEKRRRSSSSLGVTSPCRLGSTSSAIKTETSNTSWLNDFTVEDTIGRGKFAVVKKCVEKSTGHNFAAKCIRKRRHNRDCTPDILHEIAVLEMGSNHHHLIGLHKVYETNSEFVLILEYAAGGEIFDHCVGVKDSFTEGMSRRLMAQILDAVKFLHDNDIVHLDLKPQNILLSRDGTDPESDIKLVDFGLSKYIADGLEIREILGTPDYVAPEVLNYEPLSTATDIWSLGVVAYVMLTGVSPFLGETKQETLMNVTTAMLDFPRDLFDNLSPVCRDFIVKMLQRDPIDRFSAHESIEHPWITGHVLPLKLISTGKKECEDTHDEVFLNGHSTVTNGEASTSTVDESTRSSASSCTASSHSSCSFSSQDEPVPNETSQSQPGEKEENCEDDGTKLSSFKDDAKSDMDYNGNIVDAAKCSAKDSLADSKTTVQSSENSNADSNATSCSTDPSHDCLMKVKQVDSNIRSATPSPKIINLTLSSSTPTSPAQTTATLPCSSCSTESDCSGLKGSNENVKPHNSPVPTFSNLATTPILKAEPPEKDRNNSVSPDSGKMTPLQQISDVPNSIVRTTDPCLKRRRFDYCTPTENGATEIPVAD